MYVGAHLWYKVAKAEVDRTGGFGWIDHVYVEGGNTIPLPECIKANDCLWLWVAGGEFPDSADLDVVSPNMGTKSIQNLGLTTGEVYQNGKWTRTYNSGNFEPVGNVVTMLNDFDWAVMAIIRGTGCRSTSGGGSTSTGTVLFPDQSGPPLVYTFTETSFTDYSPAFFAGYGTPVGGDGYLNGYPDIAPGQRDVLISLFQDHQNFASSTPVVFHNIERYGLRLLEGEGIRAGPTLTGGPGKATRIYYGIGNNLIAPNEVSHKPFPTFDPLTPNEFHPPPPAGPHWGAPIHSTLPETITRGEIVDNGIKQHPLQVEGLVAVDFVAEGPKLAKWDHPMVSFDPPAETTYFYIRQRIW